MKLCALSPFTSVRPDDVLSFLEENTSDFILLPGACDNTPTPDQVKRVLRSRVSAFVEGKGGKRIATPYFVTSESMDPMPRQIFSEHPSAGQIRELEHSLPDRTFPLGSRHITFFICGELIAFNPDGKAKHNGTLPFDILANPAHTLMGHWNHLGRKLATLSRKTAALYCTNNDREHSGITTDVRIYRNGILLLNRISFNGLAWSECDL